ncbi:hypothetical protein QMK19_22035 [Streptomyces sp. H10-C2]|uniref:hypothetical protein n=1 Tax=unclassified Streptomyces TaxID=2593676 RepID=UPI0024BB5985|nr:MULTISPECIES: hypothetical protein [unclassified Streptomyces]MDJ0342415.1 hypothetical protein [Streptomyces sp. PH10-H1]MDJ0372270.1 hypothetical protein [Streptomyces sp. H10-C2]
MDASAVREAAGHALGVPAAQIEIKAAGYDKPLKNVQVGGGGGKVCVNGTVDTDGAVTTEVAGRTLEGTCLPGDGGH